MKVLALYLPQFHRVKENDEWWGEGFTEWTAVKGATPIFDGHYQPRRPLNDNYYDLMEKKTMCWQADLMQQYGIDGMCMYHYWFKDCRRILEKPAENLLEWKDINMPFCFCWANMTWARTWSNMRNSAVWANKYESESKEIDDGILLEQKYGGLRDWKEHFEYLLPFFKDKRYIKNDNKPVFVLYKTEVIDCLDEMTEKWQEWAIENGFNGIYFIGAGQCEEKYETLDFAMYIEPTRGFGKKNGLRKDSDNIYDYSELWNATLSHVSTLKNILYCGVVGFDETPRQGKRGKIIQGQTPELFKQYLTELMAKNEVNDSPFTFINAWNEWGEGMYLEPDEKEGYAYLEAIAYAKENYKEYLDKYKLQLEKNDNELKREYLLLVEKCTKYESYWRVLDRWLSLKENGKYIRQYFEERNIKSIAIYGAGMLGKHLLTELRDTGMVEYVIDRRADSLKIGMPIYSPEDELPKVDMVVVSATFAYREIKKLLYDKGFKKIISLENVLMEL